MKLITALLLIWMSVAMAQTIYFEDDFNDGNADGWLEASGAFYEVNSYFRYEFTVDPGSTSQAISCNSDSSGGMSVSNYSILTELCAHSPTHGLGPLVRYNFIESYGYVAYIRVYQNEVKIYRKDTSGFVELALASMNLEYDTFYWVRFTCSDTFFGVKVWTGVPGDEPDEWIVTASDSNYPDPGYFGLGAWNLSGTGGLSAEFDDVTVSQPDSLAFEQSTWAIIKSTF